MALVTMTGDDQRTVYQLDLDARAHQVDADTLEVPCPSWWTIEGAFDRYRISTFDLLWCWYNDVDLVELGITVLSITEGGVPLTLAGASTTRADFRGQDAPLP